MDRKMPADYGVDYDKGLKNCMGNEVFYKKILSMFLEDKCFEQAKLALAKGDNRELFSRMHELKGISGNAALTALYSASSPLVELLRKDGGDPAEVSRMFAEVERAYCGAREGISLILAER